MSDFIDIGFGVSIAFAEYEGKVVGFHERHPSKKDPSQPCCGFVWFDVETEARCEGTPVWQVECMDPLTLSPSILCRGCGNHGFIRQGRWVPA